MTTGFKRTLRTAAIGGVIGLAGMIMYVALGQDDDTGGHGIDRLEYRAVVTKTRLGLMTQSFRDHFRKDENVPVRGTEYELPWSVLKQLVAPSPAGGVKNGVKFMYGLDGDEFNVALSPLKFMAPVNDTVFPYADLASDVHMLKGRVLTAMPRQDWVEAYQESALFRPGRYYREMEVMRLTAGSFEKVKRSDPSAEVFAWEDEILRIHDETAPYLNQGDSVLYVVIRCVAEPEKMLITEDYPYQHRLCVFLRLRAAAGTYGRDLLDDKLDYKTLDSAATPLPFRMKGADFGNLCPPSCDTFTLTKEVP